MQHQIDDNELREEDQRDPEHKLRLLGFMADQQHDQIHGGCAAECGDQQQGAFFDAPIAFDSGVFIVDCHDDGDNINDDQINSQKFQNNLGVIECSIKE